jgi:hypothetical protein
VPDDAAGRPHVIRTAPSLGRPSRWAAFLLGLAGLGAGGTAVFITHLEAGPVALLAVGLILVLVGLAGKMPSRLKVGDNEAEFLEEREAMSGALLQSVESAPPGSKREVAGVVQRVAEVAPEVAAPAQAALEYDDMVLGLVKVVMDEPEIRELQDTAPWPVAVFPHFSQGRVPRKELEAIHDRALVRLKGSGTLLVVTNVPLSQAATDYIVDEPGLYHAVVRGPEDKQVLELGLRNALRGLKRTAD